MSFFAALGTTGPSTALSRYTVACGVAYALMGTVFYAAPGPVIALIAQLEGYTLTDTGLMRACGMMLAIIGWFYIMGGRTRADSFGLATVVDRLLVPAFLLPVWAMGELPATIALGFSVLDPVLGLIAYGIWRREGALQPKRSGP